MPEQDLIWLSSMRYDCLLFVTVHNSPGQHFEASARVARNCQQGSRFHVRDFYYVGTHHGDMPVHGALTVLLREKTQEQRTDIFFICLSLKRPEMGTIPSDDEGRPLLVASGKTPAIDSTSRNKIEHQIRRQVLRKSRCLYSSRKRANEKWSDT